MWPNGIVLFQPFLGDGPGLSQAAEQIQVKHLLSIGSIESFDVGILGRFTRLDKVKQNVMFLRPRFQFLRDEFGAIVRPQALRELPLPLLSGFGWSGFGETGLLHVECSWADYAQIFHFCLALF